jgi:hypothetical protein
MYSRELGLDIELIRRAAISSLPALVVAFWAYRLVKAFFYTPAPSGPASLGRAFGFLFSGEVMGAVTIWYLSYVWSFLVGEEFINALRLSFLVLVFVFVSTGAGYLAAHSYEKVGGMNAKIFVVTGFFLHSLISSIAFMRSGYVVIMLLSFFPSSILGVFLQLRIHNQPRQPDAH